MTKIKILPETVSNKIAAGEVVERPASVIKELIENSLDAESSRINIEIENGGKDLIAVSDNGCGMSYDDALLSIERFATSKIENDGDLTAVKTLGFRGEALPSIASVSKFKIVTCENEQKGGTQIIVEAGVIKKVSETGSPRGSMVEVKSLFFNTPARKKFLKSASTETGHIIDTVCYTAMGRPDVGFKLSHNGKTLKEMPAGQSTEERALEILGPDLHDFLKEIDIKNDVVLIRGWVANPYGAKSSAKSIYIYVNGRFVKDRLIRHALYTAFEGRLTKGRYPAAAIFINVPLDKIDVNVHPAKHEVRFVDQKHVYDTVLKSVKDAIGEAAPYNWNQYKNDDKKVFESYKISEQTPLYKPIIKSDTTYNEILEPIKNQEASFFENLKIIGQFHLTYIVCEAENEMILIDQHAAHERVVYEQLKKNYFSASPQSQPPKSQMLIIPQTLEVSFAQAAKLEEIAVSLKKAGFEIESFGPDTFVIKSVPAILWESDVKQMIIELIEKIDETGISENIDTKMDQCFAVMACHSAVKANKKMTEQEIYALLKQLDQCQNRSFCPHGRPLWISRDMQYFEKAFKRIV